MHKNCVIIFSGFNQRAIIAFIRTLTLHKVNYAIVALSKDDTILLTEYSDKVVSIRQSFSLNLSDIINSIKEVQCTITANNYFITPSSEALNRFLLDNRKEIEFENCIIPLTSKLNYENISNKYSFGQLCNKAGIKVPFEYKYIEDAPFPFVAKPKKYTSNDGSVYSPCIVVNEEDKQQFLHEYNQSDFFYQEYIYGKSFYLLYYFQRDGKIYKASQENYLQQPDGKSIVAAVSSNFHSTKESQKYENLLKSLNYFGLIMIEVKQQNKINYMIEANPRFWGPSQLFVDAKKNLFEALLFDFGLIKGSPKFIDTKKEVKYFWYGGIVSTYKRKKKLTFHHLEDDIIMNNIHIWLQSDIYKRPDTIEIFENEIL
jgi:predicted ATP-grasp superfamily ATP-dependent carboligase